MGELGRGAFNGGLNNAGIKGGICRYAARHNHILKASAISFVCSRGGNKVYIKNIIEKSEKMNSYINCSFY